MTIFSKEKKNINENENSFFNFLSELPVPSLSEEQKNTCEGFLTEKEIFDSLISFENNKSPGNAGFTKEFYITFWDGLKDIRWPYSLSTRFKTFKRVIFFSQRQAIIKLIEKPNKGKRFVSSLYLF